MPGSIGLCVYILVLSTHYTINFLNTGFIVTSSNILPIAGTQTWFKGRKAHYFEKMAVCGLEIAIIVGVSHYRRCCDQRRLQERDGI